MGMNAGPDVVEDGLVSYYDPGNILSYSGSGTALNDLIGNHNGTLAGGPSFSSTTSGGTFTFDGSDDDITLGSLPQTQQYTFEFAFSPVSYTAEGNNYQRMLISSGYTNFIVLEENRLFRHRVPGVDGTGNLGNSVIHDIDTFHIVTFSYDQSNSKNYQNGVLLETKSVGSGTVTSGTLSLFTSGAINQYSGKFGFFRAYDRALTDAEVLQNFHELRGRFGL